MLRKKGSPSKYFVMTISSGVLKGSVFGPLLWTILCDQVLTTKLPSVEFVGFAVDLAVVARGKDVVDLTGTCNYAVDRLCSWQTGPTSPENCI